MRRIRFFLTALALVLTFLCVFPVAEGVALAEPQQIYLGGFPIGISVSADGAYVDGFIDVNGKYSPAKEAGVQLNDRFLSINGNTVSDVKDVSSILTNSKGKELDVQIDRRGNISILKITPLYDDTQKSFKLGVVLRGNISGLGTVTYVTSNDRYGALGHKIFDPKAITVSHTIGVLYPTFIKGVKRGTKQNVGQLQGGFDLREKQIGTVDKNTVYGIFGYLTDKSYGTRTAVEVGARADVHPGKAFVYTTVSGVTPERYEIEIVKASEQTAPSEKGLVIRVVDKKLIAATGGIVQGMSGSPIVQDEKLVGAVSHVFTNNPLMGYGMYAEFMLIN